MIKKDELDYHVFKNQVIMKTDESRFQDILKIM